MFRWNVYYEAHKIIENNAMKKFRVTQIRSVSGRTSSVRDTLRALGLGRIGKSREHKVSPAMAGMVKRVLHLVRLEEL